jgi:hypothetical protein
MQALCVHIICLQAGHGQYDVLPALLHEILCYCYINKEIIHFTTHQYKPHHKQVILRSLSRDQKNGLTAMHIVYVKLQIEQLNAQHILYGKPCLGVKEHIHEHV